MGGDAPLTPGPTVVTVRDLAEGIGRLLGAMPEGTVTLTFRQDHLDGVEVRRHPTPAQLQRVPVTWTGEVSEGRQP